MSLKKFFFGGGGGDFPATPPIGATFLRGPDVERYNHAEEHKIYVIIFSTFSQFHMIIS